MTSISPDRSTIYDYDLSTLTNIRLNNRRAKQKLSNNVLSERSNNSQNIGDRVYGSARKSDKLDDSTHIRLFKDAFSPSPSKSFKTDKSFKTNDTHNYDIDSSYLENENLRYLDKDFYSRGSKLNELKREKFLDNINSATNYTKFPNRENLLYEDLNDVKPLKDTTNNFNNNNVRFRPRKKTFESPYLKRVTSNKNSPGRYNNDPKFSDLDYEKEQLENYDKRFDYLVDKYNLDDIEDDFKERTKSNQLRNTIDELEEKLMHYRSTLEELRDKNIEKSNENQSLNGKINDLEKYIDFLEDNFDQLYHKLNRITKGQ